MKHNLCQRIAIFILLLLASPAHANPDNNGLSPVAVTSDPTGVTNEKATLLGVVNPRNLAGTVRFEYGLTKSYGRTTTLQDFPAGDGLINVSAEITGLQPTAFYHYRIIATTTRGKSVGQDVVFKASAATPPGAGDPTERPDVTTGSAADIRTQSAELRGTVNAHGGTTVAHFEFGTTPAYGFRTANLGVGSAEGDAAVSITAEELLPGTPYHYRLVAENTLGANQGLDATFTTRFLPPTVVTGNATAISTVAASVSGSVRARNANSAVFVDYGTDPAVLDESLAVTPSTASGDTDTAVAVILPNLSQGRTYYYQVRAENSGGVGRGEIRSFDVGVLSGLFQRFPDAIAASDHQGSVAVNLSPSGIGAGWRFAGEKLWRAGGEVATGLASGERVVEFRPTPGHLQPTDETVVSASAPVILNRTYTASASAGSGGLTVTLKPENLTGLGIPATNRAQWRLFGETDGDWRNSGDTAASLVPGDYVIECKPVTGRTTPSAVSALVSNGTTTAATITYFITDAAVGVAPEILAFETLSTNEERPFAYVGQISSDVGLGTGFIVKPRVVATVGHVAFDDGALAATTGLKWLFQRDPGVHEPAPHVPRGFYLMSGYAAQRAADNSPGTSTPQSQNLDAAALYFLEDVGRAGFSGYLASDLPVNEFMVSDALKTLVGYPVDGIAPANQGRMHATPLANVRFESAFGQTYRTSDIRSSGGNSGGPLCIRHENGDYYPAAIYLGGTAETIVRALDGDVVDLFGFADGTAEVDGGDKGGSLATSDPTPVETPALGSIKVLIEPAAARSAGAGWRIQAGADYLPSGSQIDSLAPQSYTVLLSTVPGFVPPATNPVVVQAGEASTITFTYQEIISPPVISSQVALTLTRGDALNYQIVASNSPTNYTLLGALPKGISFLPGTGLISGTTEESGSFPLTIGAINAGGADSRVLNLLIKPQLADQSLTAAYLQPFSYQIVSSESGGGLAYTATSLPDGLSLATQTGLITGAPTVPGVYEIPVSVMRNGASESAKLTLTITGIPPVITQQPSPSKSIEVGSTTTLSVSASGIPAPSYQWYAGSAGDISNPIAGATSATFTTPPTDGTATYFARASNLSGSADSDESVIDAAPSFIARLAYLKTSLGDPTPRFNPGVLSYSITVPYSETSINLTTDTQAPDATVFVSVFQQTQTPQSPGIPGEEILLDPQLPTIIDIEVRAADPESPSTFYTLEVFRPFPPDVFTESATDVTGDSATLNGSFFSEGPVFVYFAYATDVDSEVLNLTTEKRFFSGEGEDTIEATLTDLPADSFIRYRIVAVTPSQDFFSGSVLSFNTDVAPPLAATGSAANITATSANLTGAYDAQGLAPTVYFEYGTTPAFGMTTELDEKPASDGVFDYTQEITGLIDGTTYYYRMVTVTGVLVTTTSFGDTVEFVAGSAGSGGDGIVDAVPTVTTDSARDITINSALLRGTVNPNDGTTFVYFEYGEDDGYGLKTATRGFGNGIQAANFTQNVTGLIPGTTYNFRIVATNSLGTSFGNNATFNASQRPPNAQTEGATALSSTSVNLAGIVRAQGAAAEIWFDYGTDPLDLTNSIRASEETANGNFGTSASVDLTNLDRALTYYYQVRAETPDAAAGLGQIRRFQIGALLGLDQRFPRIVSFQDRQGQVTVNLLPADVGGWRFEGETNWRASGVAVNVLTTGQREIIFQPVAGYIQPQRESIGVVSGEAAVILDRVYYESAVPGSGTLRINLEPAALTGAGIAIDDRLQWRLYQSGDTAWRDSGEEITGLLPGSYLVECKAVPEMDTPPPSTHLIRDGETTSGFVVYAPAGAISEDPPVLPTYGTVSMRDSLPYAYVGQIRSGTGLFSGFVVKPRVVATVAQAVFDDATLTTTTGIQWLQQQYQRSYEPKPQIPRGYYVFTNYDDRLGYAEQRELEDTPGALALESRNLNVAALYFAEDAGRGGYSGFIAADEEDDDLLLTGGENMLVGYPQYGIPEANKGRTHVISAFISAFSRALGKTYTSPLFRGLGGMEGGPLCARYQGGSIYPVAIYVGGTSDGYVRAIDRDVVDIFTRAEISGDGGANNVGGGITHTSIVSFGDPTQPGSLKVTIEPDFAIANGAGWRLTPEATLRPSGAQKSGLAPGTYTLRFPTVSGFPAPEDQRVTIEGGRLSNVTFTYAVETTDLDLWRLDKFATSSETGDSADDADPDNDGQTNIQEFVAGTRPKDTTDFYSVASAATPIPSFTATVAGKADRTYVLQRSSNLSSWTTVVAAGPLRGDAPVTLTDPSAPAGKAFYRVEVSYP